MLIKKDACPITLAEEKVRDSGGSTLLFTMSVQLLYPGFSLGFFPGGLLGLDQMLSEFQSFYMITLGTNTTRGTRYASAVFLAHVHPAPEAHYLHDGLHHLFSVGHVL